VTTDAVKPAPSILAADFARLGEQVSAAAIFNESESVTAAMGRLRSALQAPTEKKPCSSL
jgi:hypothetical protein